MMIELSPYASPVVCTTYPVVSVMAVSQACAASTADAVHVITSSFFIVFVSLFRS